MRVDKIGVSKADFTWLIFVSPEEKGYQLEVILLVITTFFCPPLAQFILCPVKVLQGSKWRGGSGASPRHSLVPESFSSTGAGTGKFSPHLGGQPGVCGGQ